MLPQPGEGAFVLLQRRSCPSSGGVPQESQPGEAHQAPTSDVAPAAPSLQV